MVYTKEQEMFGWTGHGTAKRYNKWVAGQDWFGVFPMALVQSFSCGRTTRPQHNFASHTTLQFTHYSLYTNLNISIYPIITAF